MTFILLVEPDHDLRNVLAATLASAGYRVAQASSYASAINIVQDRTDIDLALAELDLRVGRTGLDLARWLSTNRPFMPLILMSGQEGGEGRATLICPEASFLPKPLNTLTLLADIDSRIAH